MTGGSRIPNFGREDDGENSRAEWLRQVHDARTDAREIKRHMPVDIEETVVNPPRVCKLFHAAILDYADHIRPKKEQLEERWTKGLAEVSIPKGGETVTASAQDLNHVGDLQRPVSSFIHDIDWTTKSVTLNKLESFWDGDNRVQFYVEVPTASGAGTFAESVTVYLPPHAAKACYRQLDACLDHLGWTPNASVQAIEAEEPLDPNSA